MRRYSFSRKLLATCRFAVFSGNGFSFPEPHCIRYVGENDFRKIHPGIKCCHTGRGWVTIHLAEQELALCALRRLEVAAHKTLRVNKSDVESVLKGSFREMFVKDEDSTFLIRCCGSLLAHESLEVRRAMTEAVWEKICNACIHLDKRHFIALLKTHQENQNPVDPQQYLSEMKRFGVETDEETLRMLLGSVNVGGKTEENVKYVMDELKTRGFISHGAELSGALASAFAEQGKISEVESIVHSMEKQGGQLGLITSSVYVSLIKGHILRGEKDPILKLLSQMEEVGVKLSPSEYASVVSHLADVSSWHGRNYRLLAKSVMPSLRIPEGEEVHHCLRNAIVELLHCGKGRAVCDLMLSLPRSLLQSEEGKYNEGLFSAFCAELARAPIAAEEVLQVCDRVEEEASSAVGGGCGLRPVVLHAVVGHALRGANAELSVALLRGLVQRGAALRPHYFWPLLIGGAQGREGEEARKEGVLAVLRVMVELGVGVDGETLAAYALPLMQPRRNGFDVLTLLQEGAGVGGAVSRTAVTQWLLSEGHLSEAAQLNAVHRGRVDVLVLVKPLVACVVRKLATSDGPSLLTLVDLLSGMSDKSQRDVDCIGHFLLLLCDKLGLSPRWDSGKREAKALDYVAQLLKGLDARGVGISSQAADVLSQVLGAGEQPHTMPPVIACLALPESSHHSAILHPRHMGIPELEAHLVELRAKGLNDRGVLRRLFQLHCRNRDRDPQRAWQVKAEMDAAGHSYSPGMLSSFLDLLVHCGDLQKAEGVLLQLKTEHPNFKIDDYKILDMAALFCSRGRANDGVELLRSHSAGTRVRPGRAIERNVVNVVLAVHQCGDERWTPADLVAELVRCGYVTTPPPTSLVSALRRACGNSSLVLP